MLEQGTRNPEFGADKFGFRDLKGLNWNFLEPELYECSLKDGEASLSWKKNVAQLATSSSHFMLAIATAFAAPLLSLCKQPSFSLCLSGNTRTGKSVAALMAGSVLGVGDISRMLTWHATDSGLEEQLPKFNDCVCLVDDFESIKGTDVQKYQRIRDFAYSISTGAERRRHSSFPSPVKQWRTILITSMEKPICELARVAKESRKGGESIRLIDIPLLSKNRRHIFDRAEAEGAVVTPAWKRQMFRKATEACREHHGSVFENELVPIV